MVGTPSMTPLRSTQKWGVIWMIVTLFGGLRPLPATAQILTLEGAVNEALKNNERIANQSDANQQAALGVRLARNTFQPKIVPNVSGSFGQSDLNSQTY